MRRPTRSARIYQIPKLPEVFFTFGVANQLKLKMPIIYSSHTVLL